MMYLVSVAKGVRVQFDSKPKLTRCRRCGKKWCGTNLELLKIHGEFYDDISYGSRKCRDQGSKRRKWFK